MFRKLLEKYTILRALPQRRGGLPLWFRELALEIRIPCAFLLWYSIHLTRIFFEAATYFDDRIEGKSQAAQKWACTQGTLIELNRHTYRQHYLPRYSTRYTFTVNGETYESRRSTTSCMWTEWMLRCLPGDADVLSEVQYLQSVPPLRVNSPCTVFYKIDDPTMSALAHDANSYQFTFMAYFGIFGLAFATSIKTSLINMYRARLRPRRQRIVQMAKDRNLSNTADIVKK